MIRKILRNTAVMAAAVAMTMGVSVPNTSVQAAELTGVSGFTTSGNNQTSEIGTESTYNTAVGGIDAAIDAYIASKAYVSTTAEQAEEAAVVEEEVAEIVPNEVAEVTASERTMSGGVTSTVRYPQFENKLMPNVTDYMNIREEASAESEALGKLPHGAVAEVLEQGEEWTKIKSGSVVGYVKNEFVVFGDDAGDYAEENCDKVATVTTTTLKVREEASTDSTCLTLIPEGETYEVVEEEEGWTKLLISDDFTGYVSDEFIDIEFDLGRAISKEEEEAERKRQEELARQAAAAAARTTTSSTTTSSSQTSSSAPTVIQSAPSQPVDTSAVSGTRADVVNYALQFVGNPYVYGGTSLTNGCDCSGFTMSVYAHFGVYICHASYGQVNYGTQIGIYDVQPGDLLFYNNGGSRIGHVAIYIGNGQIVHASTERTGIIVSNAYYQTPCAAVRLIP